MDSSDKCCTMKVETGTLIFAILSSIATIAASIGSLYYFIYLLIQRTQDPHIEPLYIGIFVIPIAYFMLAFGFSVTLTNGVLKRNSRMLKIYFIYGAMVLTLAVVSIMAIGFSSINHVQDTSYVLMMIALGVLTVVYGLALVLVWKTFKKFQNETQFVNITTYNNY